MHKYYANFTGVSFMFSLHNKGTICNSQNLGIVEDQSRENS